MVGSNTHGIKHTDLLELFAPPSFLDQWSLKDPRQSEVHSLYWTCKWCGDKTWSHCSMIEHILSMKARPDERHRAHQKDMERFLSHEDTGKSRYWIGREDAVARISEVEERMTEQRAIV